MRWLPCLLLWAGCGLFGDNVPLQSTRNTCGDGVIAATEGCDDGNKQSGDGCSDDCAVETGDPVCGNGVREVGEGCDDHNNAAGDGCSATCALESACGNGQLEAGETCDDGNKTSGDGCSPTCQQEGAGACALVPQAGCTATSAPACDLTAAMDGTTQCRAVTQSGTSNSHCTLATQCKAGYTCTGDHNGNPSWCARFCTDDTDCTGTGSRCVIDLVNGSGATINVSVCSNACDPYGQTGCPTGMGCVLRGDGDGDYTDCLYQGTKLVGESCATARDCSPGNVCATYQGVKTCRATCIVGNASTCSSGVCSPYQDPVSIGGVNYGACI